MTTHGPIQKEVIEDMKRVGRILAETFSPFGFCLLVFDFGSGPSGRMNYLSNAKREDMLTALKELIARMEGLDPEAGHA